MIENITPLILSFNEKNNIHRTLQKLNLFQIIIIIDSYSNDETVENLKTYPQVQVFQRKFDTFANQWNYGLDQVKTDWVLSLDADYIITGDFIYELDNLSDDSVVDGYFACFKYCVFGKPLRGTLLPPRLVLFRREKAFYFDDGHTQKLHLNGRSGQLLSYIYHDDRKPLSRWINSQDRYMILETQKLIEKPTSQLSFGDRIRRKKIIAPFIILFYCLILKGGILDGWAGWYYALQRMLAEILLAIRLIEAEKANDIAQKQ